MPIIRKDAVQGHYVPKGPYRAHGPFPAELYHAAPIEREFYDSDSLHESLDDVRFFRCKFCGDVLYENELDSHDCESDEE
jgi:hypothetical protein